MIADIFYPIFNLTIIILAYFIRKKAKLFRDLHIRVHHDIALDRLGGLKPQFQLFLALPRTDAPIFFLYYPLILLSYFRQSPLASTLITPLLSSSYTSTFPLHTDKFIFRQLRIFHKIKLAEKKNLSPNV